MRSVRPFIKFIGISRLATLGAALVTASFLADALLIIGDILFGGANPYIGIVAYMVFPPLIMLGLAVIPVGIWWRLRKLRRPINLETLRRLSQFGVLHRPGALLRIVLMLTLINLLAFGLLGYRGYHYMDSTGFCGQVCHSVMAPEYTTYQHSPHSEVECVQCHIGPGAGWFVKSKISGAWQVISVNLDLYSRPIETPIDNLRPAREVCENCHRPEMFHGNLIRVREHFDPDKGNTPRYTILNMRVGGGSEHGQPAEGIHWHVGLDHELRYYATDHKREHIVYIEAVGPDGVEHTWTRPGEEFDRSKITDGQMRVMDCVDCHNRPTHIYLPPVEAIEQRMIKGEIDPKLPWVRKVAGQVLTPKYATREEAMTQIEQRTIKIYRDEYPDVWAEQEPAIRKAIAVLQDIHRLNVFPQMNIQWNTYTSQIGHPSRDGKARCFRCHDGRFRDETGQPITLACNACHYILAQDNPDTAVLNILKGNPAYYRGGPQGLRFND